jgi:hypothetical protein
VVTGDPGRVRLYIKICRLRAGEDKFSRVRAGKEFFRDAMKNRQNLSIDVFVLHMYSASKEKRRNFNRKCKTELDRFSVIIDYHRRTIISY